MGEKVKSDLLISDLFHLFDCLVVDPEEEKRKFPPQNGKKNFDRILGHMDKQTKKNSSNEFSSLKERSGSNSVIACSIWQ